MSYDTVPQGETGRTSVPLLDQERIAKRLFERHWHVLDIHAILEHVVTIAPDLPPGLDTSARVYRRFERKGAAQTEKGGVCLFPAGEPGSPFRVNVDVYQGSGYAARSVNKFTTEQVGVVLGLLEELDMEHRFGELPDLSPDRTHIELPDISTWLD